MNETPAIELCDSASGDQPPLSESGLPPLRLHHFFALTAVSAVLMSTFGPAISSFSKISFLSHYWVVLAVGGTIYTFLVAFAMTVTAYGFFWHQRGIPYPRYPGHWLLVAITASYILGFVVAAIIPEFAQNTAWFRWTWKLPIAAVDIFIGRVKCVERRWRWTFYLRALAAIVPILGDLLLLIMISRANLGDRRLGVRRDVLHRCGVAIQIVQCLLLVGFFFFIMLSAMLRLL